MSEHSQLLEWLAQIPPLPWHATDEKIIDTRGLPVLRVDHSGALRIEQYDPVVAYAAHCATHLPVLVRSAHNFLNEVSRHFPMTQLPFRVEVWNKLTDALRDAKAIYPGPLDEPESAQPKLAGVLVGIRDACQTFLKTSEQKQGFDSGEAIDLVRAIVSSVDKGIFGQEVKDVQGPIANPAIDGTPLEAFVDTVNATGGVTKNPDGTYSPEGEPEWLDLGEAYARACEELGVPIKLAEEEKEEDVLGCPKCGHEWPKSEGPPCPKCGG